MAFRSLALATTILVFSTSANAELITNGSFTGPVDNGVFSPPAVPPGWSIFQGTPDTQDVDHPSGVVSQPDWQFVVQPSGPSPDGGTFLGLVYSENQPNHNPEAVFQHIAGLTAGRIYEISWYQANFGAATLGGEFVYAGGNGIQISFVQPGTTDELVWSIGDPMNVGPDWIYQSILLGAVADSVDLVIGLSSPVPSYLSIDGISMTEVAVIPVPAAVWLFGSGLIGLIGIATRKRA